MKRNVRKGQMTEMPLKLLDCSPSGFIDSGVVRRAVAARVRLIADGIVHGHQKMTAPA